MFQILMKHYFLKLAELCAMKFVIPLD